MSKTNRFVEPFSVLSVKQNLKKDNSVQFSHSVMSDSL